MLDSCCRHLCFHTALHPSPTFWQLIPQWASPHNCSCVLLYGPTIWQQNSEWRYRPLISLPTYLNSLLADSPSPFTWIWDCHPCMQSLALCHSRTVLSHILLFFLFFHISFLYTHTSAFCHIICQAKQCLPLLLHHLMFLYHPNTRTQK